MLLFHHHAVGEAAVWVTSPSSLSLDSFWYASCVSHPGPRNFLVSDRWAHDLVVCAWDKKQCPGRSGWLQRTTSVYHANSFECPGLSFSLTLCMQLLLLAFTIVSFAFFVLHCYCVHFDHFGAGELALGPLAGTSSGFRVKNTANETG